MKFLILTATLAATLSTALTSSVALAKSILANYNFTFQNQSKSFQAQDSVILQDDGRWAALGQIQKGVSLLCSLTPSANHTFAIRYLVVDTDATPTSVRELNVLTPLNLDAEISITEDDQSKIAVGVTLKDLPSKLNAK